LGGPTMLEIDKFFFNKYAIDPDGQMFASDEFAEEGVSSVEYAGFEVTGLDEEEWPEVN